MKFKQVLFHTVSAVFISTVAFTVYVNAMAVTDVKPTKESPMIYKDHCYWSIDKEDNLNLISGSCDIQRKRDLEMGRVPFNPEDY